MRLNSSTRSRRIISLTPLIDVVFLLLVFFMLSSTFLKFGTVKIDSAGAGGGTADLSKIVLVHVGANGALQVNGAPVLLSDMKTLLDGHVDDGQNEAVVVSKPGSTVSDLIRGVTEIRRSAFKSVRVVD